MLFQIIIITLLVILALNALYLFVFSAAGMLSGKENLVENFHSNQKRILVLIPGYKEDAVIMSSVQSVMLQSYPKELFECVVLADSFQSSTIDSIKQAGAGVFQLPEDESRNKAKSIQKFLGTCYESYDACIVLDADNCVDESMLQKANNYLKSGSRIIKN
jgi:cellulose synthase/poly-beta-1,6-N-acetylglucosamine synthase-like glycosyltransferase